MQSNVLSQLKDIHTPEPIGWWPLAWGWYVVIVTLIIGVVLLFTYLKKRRSQLLVKKAALNAMHQLEQQPMPLATVRAINDILKRAVLGYAQREYVAEPSGEEWANLLNELADADSQIDPNLLNLAYQPKCSAKDADEYYSQALVWLQNTLPLSAQQIALIKKSEGQHV